MADEIIDNLWLGDLNDAYHCMTHNEFDRVINVLNLIEPDDKGLVDFQMLNALALIIDRGLESGERILVHCGAGMERSPLVVVYYLWQYKDYTLISAYEYVKRKRQIVQDRGHWLSIDTQYNMSRKFREYENW